MDDTDVCHVRLPICGHMLPKAASWAQSLLLLVLVVLAGCSKEGEIVFVKDLYGNLPALYTMRPDGNDVKRLTLNCLRYEPSTPAWSPDGRRIAFAYDPGMGHDLFLMTPTDAGTVESCDRLVKRLTIADTEEPICGGTITSITWAPDGQRLAYTCSSHNVQRICLIDLDVRRPECWSTDKLVEGSGRDGWVTTIDWSPVAERLAVSIRTSDRAAEEVYTVDPDGSDGFLLTAGRLASWSPNGKQLAFFVDGLYTIDATGDHRHCILAYPKEGSDELLSLSYERLPGYVSRPSWSPDGRSLVLSGSRAPDGGLTAIYVIDVKSGQIQRITEYYDGHFGDPDWSIVR